MSTPRCGRSAAIIEALLAGEPLAGADRAHLGGCAACTRLAARVPSLESGIARAAMTLSAAGPIPAGVIDAGIVEAPIGRERGRIGLRLASMAAVAGVAALVTAIGLGLLRPASTNPPPGAVELGPAAIVGRLEAAGLACAEVTLEKQITPPRVGHACKPPPLVGVDRYASVFTTPSAETWLQAMAMVDDRADDAQVRPAVAFLLDAASAAIPDPSQATTVRGFLGTWLADRHAPRDLWVILGDRVVELEGSWAQGFTLRIGPH